MSSRSPGVSELGPRNSTSTRSLSGRAVSGRNAIGPRMPGRSGSAMCGMVSAFGTGGHFGWPVGLAEPHVAVRGQALAHRVVGGRIRGREGGEAVDVAVVHAEGRGDEHRVVNLHVGGAVGARLCDVVRGDLLAALLYLARD